MKWIHVYLIIQTWMHYSNGHVRNIPRNGNRQKRNERFQQISMKLFYNMNPNRVFDNSIFPNIMMSKPKIIHKDFNNGRWKGNYNNKIQPKSKPHIYHNSPVKIMTNPTKKQIISKTSSFTKKNTIIMTSPNISSKKLPIIASKSPVTRYNTSNNHTFPTTRRAIKTTAATQLPSKSNSTTTTAKITVYTYSQDSLMYSTLPTVDKINGFIYSDTYNDALTPDFMTPNFYDLDFFRRVDKIKASLDHADETKLRTSTNFFMNYLLSPKPEFVKGNVFYDIEANTSQDELDHKSKQEIDRLMGFLKKKNHLKT